jgi:hypothetical protein
LIARYAFKDRWATAFRAEYYQDKTGVIIPKGTPNGFRTSGFSFNIDYAPTQVLSCRLEGRWFNSKDKIFRKENRLTNDNLFVVTSIAILFD